MAPDRSQAMPLIHKPNGRGDTHTYIHATFFIFIFYDINVHNMYVYDILSFCKYT